MIQRPAIRLHGPMLAGVLALTLASCNRAKESPVTPPPASPAPVEATETAPPTPPATAPEPPAASAPAPVVAGEDAPEPPASTPGTSLPGAIPPAPMPDSDPKAAAQPPPDPLKWLQDSEARRADYQRRLSDAEANLAIATASVADWERTVLAFKNPFLARPKLAAEDAQVVEGMDGAQRVRWAEGRLATAKDARDAAQKARDDLKRNPPE